MSNYEFMMYAQIIKVLIETNLKIKEVKKNNQLIPLAILEDMKQELEYYLSKLTQ
ncbi:MAG: hypothetical protein IIC67_02315 [Thaumarchaeota archaeon]|nr:hypothetical protein [Nitrososphaerota archaeon]